MIALAEAGNDIVVLDHRHAESDAARQIAAIASDLAALSYAAEVLARLQTRT
jgi:2-keto-3-deoxy-L-rhamnonate aldolase RhmA